MSAGIRSDDAHSHGERQRRTACALLQRLYGANPSPGVILGDEVGMGKTYEALAVIAALFRHKPSARVLVLTHNGNMARTWDERWAAFRDHVILKRLSAESPEGCIIGDIADIRDNKLCFASYDGLKKMPTQDVRAALERCFIGRWIHGPLRRQLVTDVLDRYSKATHSSVADKISKSALDAFWRTHYDSERRTWHRPWSAWNDLRAMVYRASRTRVTLDLLVVDEAHKVASRQRNMFFTEVLGSRTRRALYVSATPFSLSVDQLLGRIKDMHVVTGAPLESLATLERQLGEYREVVKTRAPLVASLKATLESNLRRFLVRSLWSAEVNSGVERRRSVPIDVDPHAQDVERAFATLALETSLLRLSRSGKRTHSTAHRETLCSSYAAIREAAHKAKANSGHFAKHLRVLSDFLPVKRDSPKFEAVLSYIEEKARRREKVVVFCGRKATIQAFRRAVHDRLVVEMAEDRAEWDRIRARIRRMKQANEPVPTGIELAKFRLAVHHFGGVRRGQEKALVHRLARHLAKPGEPGGESSREVLWDQSWGSRRRTDWVATLAGHEGTDVTRRSPEATQFAFNLPGPPYILLCTEVAREGIDLHLWCRRIVQYDLEWNPALMEQQIGRVDRIGSLSRRIRKPVEVLWTRAPGTYDDYIGARVQERMQMMKVLLGAGEWLSVTPEDQEKVTDLDGYKLNFAP